MKMKLAAIGLVAGALMLPVAGFAAETETHAAKTWVKDSIITTKVKAELAEEKLSSLAKISVDTDNAGNVRLGGTAPTQAASEKAIVIARAVKGVTSVESHIKVVADK